MMVGSANWGHSSMSSYWVVVMTSFCCSSMVIWSMISSWALITLVYSTVFSSQTSGQPVSQ